MRQALNWHTAALIVIGAIMGLTLGAVVVKAMSNVAYHQLETDHERF